MYKEITACRMTGSPDLVSILDLGSMALTGVFPAPAGTPVAKGPVELVLCPDGGLVQLRQSYDPTALYGQTYGYRSGLNQSMVRHLGEKAQKLQALAGPVASDVVLDIGSNDGTLLAAYTDVGQLFGGIDPSGDKFRAFYPPGALLVPDFFSTEVYRWLFGERQAKIVTSIAMFYDLERPLDFMREVAGILADDGIWHLEQSYLPVMLDQCAYDTICQEHLEYYALSQIKWMADRAELEVVDVELNTVNGGSFAVTLAKRGAYVPNEQAVDGLLAEEARRGLDRPGAYDSFCQAVYRHRVELPALIRSLRADGKEVLGYGASTKGNVLLQACGLTAADLPCIADVNPDKHGCVTPGTEIPIVSEWQAHAMKPDYFVVFPWHFRNNLLAREQAFLDRGGKMIFPLPTIQVVGA